MQLQISKIIVKDRIRKEMGDLVSLEKSINKIGLLHPIVVNQNNELIAGQRRLQACKNLDLDEIEVVSVTLTRERDGEIDENQIRRDFTPDEAQAIKEWIHDEIAAKNKEKKEEGKNQYSDNEASGQCPEASESPKETREEEQEKTGYSSTTMRKIESIKKEAETNPEYAKLWKELNEDYLNKNRKNKLSIDKVYQKLTKEKKKKERKEAIKETQVILPDTITLYNQEFQTAPIQDNSVSLIFTDPPYHEKYLSLYDDLGKQAAKVLKDGGSLVTYAGHFNLQDVINAIEKHGLKYEWIFAILHSGPSTRIHSKKIQVSWKPMLYFSKGKYEGGEISDSVKSEYQGKELHEWAQSTIESDQYIKSMTIENEIVYDPFMGQGTFGVSTSKLKRQFIGCEIDKEHFENARRLISNATN